MTTILLIGCPLMFVVGAVVGGQVNRGIFRLALQPLPIGPWSAPHPDAPPRSLADRIPILGWLGMRRECIIHGDRFWIRPLLIELGMAVSFAWLFWWELTGQVIGGLPDHLQLFQYTGHVVLISFMTVATFTDLNDQIIPDEITVPGTMSGLLLSALIPDMRPLGKGAIPVDITTPIVWPDWLDGWQGVLLGCSLYCAWCWALMHPHKFWFRGGVGRGVRIFLHTMWRKNLGWLIAAPIGCLVIAAVWLWSTSLNPDSWRAMLTSLVGMAGAGGLIWGVRIAGQLALGREAMGFGDVTLMAMIGSFWGWQAGIIIFLLAPFTAIAVSIAQWIATRENHIAFGPYLSLATVIVMLNWQQVWTDHAVEYFSAGWAVPGFVFFFLVLMGGMLKAWNVFKRIVGGEE